MTMPVSVATTPTLAAGNSWLDWRHPIYLQNAPKWAAASDHYAGLVLDKDRVTNYLIRKATAEAEQAYLERVGVADYTPHFPTCVDALAGMLFAVEGEANRFLGDDEKKGLGDASDEASPMHRLWRDADGQGTGWLTFFKQLAIELIVTHTAWTICDQDENEQAILRMWPASEVINWWYDRSGRLAEVLLREKTDLRTSVKDDVRKIQEQYVLYTLQGWERYTKDARGNPQKIDEKPWGAPFTDRNENPILPIWPVHLPLRRNVGYLMAMKANAIFNKESERDNLLRTANFPILVLVGTDDQYKAHVADIKRGVRALRHDPSYNAVHQFIAPDAGPATVATDVLKRKVEEFYVAFFKEYGDAAREKTATETRQDVSSGVGAFLQMLKAGVDDAENGALDRIAQVEFPTDQKRWFISRVERSDNFVPTDIEKTVSELKSKYFPSDQPVPLGPSGLENLVKKIAEYDGIDVNEDELKAAIMTGEYKRLADVFRDLPIPASVRVAMTLELLTALGLVDPEEKVKMDDDTDKLLIEQIKEEMLDLAMADDEAKRRMAQPLDMGSGGGPIPPRKLPPGKE